MQTVTNYSPACKICVCADCFILFTFRYRGKKLHGSLGTNGPSVEPYRDLYAEITSQCTSNETWGTDEVRNTARDNIIHHETPIADRAIDNDENHENDINLMSEILPEHRSSYPGRERTYAKLLPHLKSHSVYLELGKLQNLEISREFLSLREVLYEGAYGNVVKAEAWNIAGKEGMTVVAIKTMNEDAVAADKKSFLQEIDFMKTIGSSEHVVSMLGCCSESEPYYIILEYMEYGNLQTHLRVIRDIKGAIINDFKEGKLTSTNADILKYSHQIAIGMEFISSTCIHRDLATRNVLVNERGVCKITGFGLASTVVDEREYRRKTKGRLPIRWLALEAIDGTDFTTKSDVWSFGILLWEIVTNGNKPYPDLSNMEVKSSLQKGYRMPKPLQCCEDLYAIMLSCWSADQNARPSFSELKTMLNKLANDGKTHIDVETI